MCIWRDLAELNLLLKKKRPHQAAAKGEKGEKFFHEGSTPRSCADLTKKYKKKVHLFKEKWFIMERCGPFEKRQKRGKL